MEDNKEVLLTQEGYEKLEKELGADYELISELEKDKHMYMDNRIFADK